MKLIAAGIAVILALLAGDIWISMKNADLKARFEGEMAESQFKKDLHALSEAIYASWKKPGKESERVSSIKKPLSKSRVVYRIEETGNQTLVTYAGGPEVARIYNSMLETLIYSKLSSLKIEQRSGTTKVNIKIDGRPTGGLVAGPDGAARFQTSAKRRLHLSKKDYFLPVLRRAVPKPKPRTIRPPPITLKGILWGSDPEAIVEMDGGNQKSVSKGEKAGEGLVEDITETAMILSAYGRRYYITTSYWKIIEDKATSE